MQRGLAWLKFQRENAAHKYAEDCRHFFPQISDYVCRLELKFGRGRTPSWQKEFPENRVLVVQDWSEDLTIFKHMMVSPTRYFLKWLQRRLEAKLKSFSEISCHNPHLKGFKKPSTKDKDKNCQGQGSENKRHELTFREGRSNGQWGSIATHYLSTQDPYS